MVKVRYLGITNPKAAFDALRPFRQAIIEMEVRCKPFGTDYLDTVGRQGRFGHSGLPFHARPQLLRIVAAAVGVRLGCPAAVTMFQNLAPRDDQIRRVVSEDQMQALQSCSNVEPRSSLPPLWPRRRPLRHQTTILLRKVSKPDQHRGLGLRGEPANVQPLQHETKSRAALMDIIRAMRDRNNNQPPLPAVFPATIRRSRSSYATKAATARYATPGGACHRRFLRSKESR